MKKNPAYNILYEDDRLIAVNKAPGIAVGGDRWDQTKERLDKLLLARPVSEECAASKQELYTVHRIDKDTSGLVIFAKDEEAHRLLSMAFESRQISKRYIAVVHGRASWAETACDLPLVPNGDKLHRTIVDKYQGKKSLTRFRLLGAAGNYSVIEALPETGRTHQIRVHLSCLGHPIVCDPLYGKSAGRSVEKGVYLSSFKKGWRGDPLDEQPLLNRLGLHAGGLIIPGYSSIAPDFDRGETLTLNAPLPRDMDALISQMAKCGGAEINFHN
jgi:23S rRNA pseudouridine1911/1915/1917 synthase